MLIDITHECKAEPQEREGAEWTAAGAMPAARLHDANDASRSEDWAGKHHALHSAGGDTTFINRYGV